VLVGAGSPWNKHGTIWKSVNQAINYLVWEEITSDRHIKHDLPSWGHRKLVRDWYRKIKGSKILFVWISSRCYYLWVVWVLLMWFCCRTEAEHDELKASPPALSIWLDRVKFIVKKSKCASWAQEKPNSCSLPWLVKGATQMCTSKKECNKLDLSAVQYFCLVDHTDWSRWFAMSSSHIYAVPLTILLVGLPKKTDKRRHLIFLSRVTY